MKFVRHCLLKTQCKNSSKSVRARLFGIAGTMFGTSCYSIFNFQSLIGLQAAVRSIWPPYSLQTNTVMIVLVSIIISVFNETK